MDANRKQNILSCQYILTTLTGCKAHYTLHYTKSHCMVSSAFSVLLVKMAQLSASSGLHFTLNLLILCCHTMPWISWCCLSVTGVIYGGFWREV